MTADAPAASLEPADDWLEVAAPPRRDLLRFAAVADRTVGHAALLAFVVQLGVLVPRHEAWFDEAQAWLVTRDSGLGELFTEQLGYEGTPGLWHLLLALPAKLGAPYETMGWIAAAIAAVGAALLVARSPFPGVVKAGILGSYVVGYQFAAVARSYVLIPVLMFGVASLWPRRHELVLPVCGLLALIACVSLHGTLIAGCIAAVLFVEALWRRRSVGAGRAHLLGAAFLLLVAVGVAFVVWPPADLIGPGDNAPRWYRLPQVPRLLASSLTGEMVSTAFVAVVSAAWFLRTRVFWLWALPTAALLVLSAVKYHSPWHEGLPFVVWVFALWVSLDRPAPVTRWWSLQRVATLVTGGCVLALHVAWFGQAWRHDFNESYSGSRALAAYLDAVPEEAEVFATSWHSLGALPYLDHNPYDNYRDGRLPGYFDWSLDLDYADRPLDLYVRDPDLVVWGVKFPFQRDLPALPDYRVVARFPGEMWYRDRIIEADAFVVFERLPDASGPNSNSG